MKIYILCVDDEPDVLDVVVRELAELEDGFPLETAETAAEARGVIDRIHADGDRVGLIFCDHVMPGENGVDLLVALQQRPETRKARKVLLTGQAGLDATVRAVNRASLNHYVAKPWDSHELVSVAREQLTRYVVDAGVDPLPLMRYLDPTLLGEALRSGMLGDR